MRHRLILQLATCVVTASCSPASAPESEPERKLVMVAEKHPNGLSVELPTDAVVEQTSRGFAVTLGRSGARRAPDQIEIELRTGARPTGDWPESRSLGARTARYRIESFAGGSGGTEYILTAWIPVGEETVYLEHWQQKEPPAEPSYDLSWSILASASKATAQ